MTTSFGPGPAYSVWISKTNDRPDIGDPLWLWQHEQDFSCADDPEGHSARTAAHGYAHHLRKAHPCSVVAVLPAGQTPKAIEL